jgi:hypothetical protein
MTDYNNGQIWEMIWKLLHWIGLQEQEACMMENDYIKLEKERDALRSALNRIRPIPERILRGIPVRDLAETLAEADSALIKGESHE